MNMNLLKAMYETLREVYTARQDRIERRELNSRVVVIEDEWGEYAGSRILHPNEVYVKSRRN